MEHSRRILENIKTNVNIGTKRIKNFQNRLYHYDYIQVIQISLKATDTDLLSPFLKKEISIRHYYLQP